MKQNHQQFRIGTLAHQLGVKKFVIRFWEKEFGITSHRSNGGQRFYKLADFEQFKLIKELLYEKGFTIAGAKKILENNDPDIVNQTNITLQAEELRKIIKDMVELQKQLHKLHRLL